MRSRRGELLARLATIIKLSSVLDHLCSRPAGEYCVELRPIACWTLYLSVSGAVGLSGDMLMAKAYSGARHCPLSLTRLV